MIRPFTLGQRLAADLDDLRELEREDPAAAEAIRTAIVSHLRSAWPESIAPMGALPIPEAPITDPRETT
jgi:hypothetical protein